MPKTMQAAYDDMTSNLAKSTAAVPLHLQEAAGALAWWQGSDSLLAKASIADEGDDVLEKSLFSDPAKAAIVGAATAHETHNPKEISAAHAQASQAADKQTHATFNFASSLRNVRAYEASKFAHDLTRKAIDSRLVSDIQTARDAHDAAYTLHFNAGNMKQAQAHKAIVAAHDSTLADQRKDIVSRDRRFDKVVTPFAKALSDLETATAELAKSVAHPGFKAVAEKIAEKEGVSEDEASAELAASSRKASKSAKKKNPHLKRVDGGKHLHKALGMVTASVAGQLSKAMVSRDPFARTEIHRTAVTPAKGKTCDNCGGLAGNGKLYQYHQETDAGRKFPIRGQFCGKGCFEAYHG